MDYDTYFILLHLIFTMYYNSYLTSPDLHMDNDTNFTSPDLHMDNDTYFT